MCVIQNSSHGAVLGYDGAEVGLSSCLVQQKGVYRFQERGNSTKSRYAKIYNPSYINPRHFERFALHDNTYKLKIYELSNLARVIYTFHFI